MTSAHLPSPPLCSQTSGCPGSLRSAAGFSQGPLAPERPACLCRSQPPWPPAPHSSTTELGHPLSEKPAWHPLSCRAGCPFHGPAAPGPPCPVRNHSTCSSHRQRAPESVPSRSLSAQNRRGWVGSAPAQFAPRVGGSLFLMEPPQKQEPCLCSKCFQRTSSGA